MNAACAALAALFRDPAFRQAVREELVAPADFPKLFTAQWDYMEILEPARPENKHLEGRNVAELAEGADPLDWFLDFGIADDFAKVISPADFFPQIAIFFVQALAFLPRRSVVEHFFYF